MRRLAPALALAVALATLAGCVNNAPASVAPASVLDPLLGGVAAAPHVIDPAGGQGEPSLGIAPDGTLYANGLAGTGGRDPGAVYQSVDNGTTWKRIAAPTAPMPNADPDLAMAKDGTLWFSSLWVGCSSTASSKDAGKTWTVSYLGCTPPAGDRQYLIPTKAGTAYIYSHHVPTFYQTVAKTTDYGATWTPSGVAEGGPLAIAQNGQSGWGGGGFWNAKTGSVWTTFTWYNDIVANTVGSATTAWKPAAGVTYDEGATWKLVQAPNKGGTAMGLGLVVGAADEAGNVYLAWGEAKEKDTAIYLAASKDDGKTWSQPIVVDDDAGSKVFPAIAAGADGHVAVAYYHADQHDYPSNVPPTTHWNVTLAWTKDAFAAAPAFERANLSAHSVRTGPICPDGTVCQGNRQLLDYFALKVAPDGSVASVWTSTDDVPGKTVNVFGRTTMPILGASS